VKSGYHDHFCEKCGHGFICPKVTHCNDEWKTLCPDHKNETRQQKPRRHVIERPKPTLADLGLNVTICASCKTEFLFQMSHRTLFGSDSFCCGDGGWFVCPACVWPVSLRESTGRSVRPKQ